MWVRACMGVGACVYGVGGLKGRESWMCGGGVEWGFRDDGRRMME